MTPLLAGVVVLVGATVWNGGEEPQSGQSVVIRDDRIVRVAKRVEVPRGATVIDLEGALVTPGLIDPAARLGLEPLGTSSAAGSTELLGAHLRAALRAADTYDPRALEVELARQQGVTAAVALPEGGVVSGQAAWVALTERAAVRDASVALVASIGRPGGAASRSAAFLHLREALEDARLYRGPGNRGAYIRNSLRPLAPSAQDLEALARALEGETRFVVRVDRASDIRTVLEIVRDQKLDAILLGVREGWRVAAEIAAARVPVVVDPLVRFSADPAPLDVHPENARLLLEAGVRVAFTSAGAGMQSGRLRLAAGNAVASGFPRAAALDAITRVPAEIFGRKDEGRLRAGARADLVVWNGDPFEPLHWPVRICIDGREQSPRARSDQLLERYLGTPERGDAP